MTGHTPSFPGTGVATSLPFGTIGRYFSQRAFETERYFTSIAETRTFDFLPRTYCGFECKTMRRNTLSCVDSYDSRAVLSLALFEQKTILSAYANKTPIMCINVSRLAYTLRAFEFANRFDDPVSEALDFLIVSDIQHLDEHQRDETSRVPPNALFSKLLHSLRSSGYERYIFMLAEHLNLDVDLVRCHDETPDSRKIMFRYKRTPPTATEVSRFSRADSVAQSTAVGVITAVNHGSRWFVKTTKAPIVN